MRVTVSEKSKDPLEVARGSLIEEDGCVPPGEEIY